jgi:hypothetical protein
LRSPSQGAANHTNAQGVSNSFISIFAPNVHKNAVQNYATLTYTVLIADRCASKFIDVPNIKALELGIIHT